ncbi:MAG: hypothetical protein A2W99_09610 [Bacteroidetes bacterium GWF2_33_16]|nr:MAG: hypothetical protein A2X00_06520 [Bacteroidetes bacterium GWE2_32_14]OFY07249.1 MAG: hypothetical protein A2W99_09610 [Bacteroidetes bacterium GWF2_33_16]
MLNCLLKLALNLKTILTLLYLWASLNNVYGLGLSSIESKKPEKYTHNNFQSTNFNDKKDTLKLLKLHKNEIKSEQFYDSLRIRAAQNSITKRALSLILVNQSSNNLQIYQESKNTEIYFEKYKGKTIRSIEFIGLNVFGPSLNNSLSSTTNWLQRTGNQTHIKTRNSILKNNLFFIEGDSIDPIQLADNEVLLRGLDFIKDAYIQIVEIPDNDEMVDILVITRDIWSIGFSVNFYNTSSGSIEVYENNLAGIGHRLEGSLFINTLYLPTSGFEFGYQIDNISNSFIKTRINYYNAFETERYGIEIWRRFHSYNTKYAGSAGIYQTSTIKDIKKTDTTLYNVRLNYSTQDFWFGRSFQLKTGNLLFRDRTRIVLGARFTSNYFYKGPEVSERYNYLYHNNQVLIGTIAFAQKKYYKSNLIYGFGKIEDIPIGNLLQANVGYERDEFFKRTYIGANYSAGFHFSNFGYLNYKIDFGGFLYEKRLEQGVISLKTQYITNIHYLSSLKHREFFSLNYTRGINRFNDENIYFDSNKDIWGFKSDYLFGQKKLAFHAESDAYTDLFIYNFRFVFFAFGDLGFIGPESKSIFKNKMYSGIGLGMRIRNENLVFKTLQFRFAFFPSIPADSEYFYYMFSGESYSKPINFEPSAPYTIDYK